MVEENFGIMRFGGFLSLVTPTCCDIKLAAEMADLALEERKKRWNLKQRFMNIFSF